MRPNDLGTTTSPATRVSVTGTQHGALGLGMRGASPNPYPKAANGLTLPLSRSLGSQDLAQHRAMVAVELEVLAKKLDRFGWERDRNSPAHDRIVMDWMDALQDYPLDEIRAACHEAVLSRPNAMPNEGHIIAEIQKSRALFLRLSGPKHEPEPERNRVSAERAAEILAEAGFKPKTFTGE